MIKGGENGSAGVGLGKKGTNKSGIDPLDMQKMAKSHGISAAALNANPELMTILKDILKDQAKGIIWDAKEIASRLANTEYLKTHTENWMLIEKDRLAKDPAIWNGIVKEKTESIKQQFIAAGADIDDATAIKYAEQTIYGSGWNGESFEIYDEDFLQDTIAQAIDYTKTGMVGGVEVYDYSGAAETQAEALYELARSYGMDTSMSNSGFTSWFQKSIKGMMDGTLAAQDVDDELINNAVGMFPGLKKQLQSGSTLMEAADPYMKMIADTWEVPQNSLTLNDDMVQQVLNYGNGDDGFAPMNLYDVKKKARGHANWDYTETAKEEKMDIASKMLKDFGFLA